MTSKGMGNIKVRKKDERNATIRDVLHVPSIASNLISLGQLLDKYYTIKLEGRELKVFNEMSRLIFNAPLSTNKTLKVMFRSSMSCINHS